MASEVASDWAFGGALGAFGPYLFILIAGWLATDIWRFLGVIFAGELKEDSEIIRWVKAVATALIAGVIAQLIFFPTGVLADTPLFVRTLALAAGVGAYLLSRRVVLAGIVAAELALLGGWLAFAG